MYLKTISFMHPWQRGAITAMTKKGSQQMMKAPVTMANVFAAFFSRFASKEMCFFSFFSFRGLNQKVIIWEFEMPMMILIRILQSSQNKDKN